MKSLSPQDNESDLNNGPYLMHNATSNSVFKIIPQHVFYMHGGHICGPHAAITDPGLAGFMLLSIYLRRYCTDWERWEMRVDRLIIDHEQGFLMIEK